MPASCSWSSFTCPVRVNTGVLLLHLSLLRARGLSSASALLGGRNYGNFSHDRDQILINGWLASRPGDGYVLPCRWNRRTDSKCEEPYGILHGNRRVLVDRAVQRYFIDVNPLDARRLVLPKGSIYNDCYSWLMEMRFIFEWLPWHDWHHELTHKNCNAPRASPPTV